MSVRVTEKTNFGAITDSIQRSKGRMEKLQSQTATLKKLNTPADNPVGTTKVLEVRTDKVNNDQFTTTARLAEAFLENSDHALADLVDITVRAKEIALSQASGPSSNDSSRLGVAEEVSQLYQQALAAANRKIGTRYLFGGYRTDNPPVDIEGSYRGDDGEMMVEVSKDVYLAMNIPGIEVFNTSPGDSKDGRALFGEGELASSPTGQLKGVQRENVQNVNVFSELLNLRTSLLTGDLEGIRGTLERFDQAHTRLVATRAKIGSRIQGLRSTVQTLERHNITNANVTSELEDADMAKVVTDLAKEETIFRSALASSQRLVQPTLLDFLK